MKLIKPIAKISYKAMLGVLNSKLIGWYFRKKFQISDTDVFPQIMIRDIQQFSVPNVENEITTELEELVSRVIAEKELNTNVDTSDLEGRIDELIYELYGLTEEEIGVVEGG